MSTFIIAHFEMFHHILDCIRATIVRGSLHPCTCEPCTSYGTLNSQPCRTHPQIHQHVYIRTLISDKKWPNSSSAPSTHLCVHVLRVHITTPSTTYNTIGEAPGGYVHSIPIWVFPRTPTSSPILIWSFPELSAHFQQPAELPPSSRPSSRVLWAFSSLLPPPCEASLGIDPSVQGHRRKLEPGWDRSESRAKPTRPWSGCSTPTTPVWTSTHVAVCVSKSGGFAFDFQLFRYVRSPFFNLMVGAVRRCNMKLKVVG